MFVHEISFDLSYFLLVMFIVSLNGFVDKNTVIPIFNLVNQLSLNKILKAKVIVHIDGQLRAAHLIFNYIPISKSFQKSRFVIKARDQCCYSRLPHHRSYPRRYSYHQSNP